MLLQDQHNEMREEVVVLKAQVKRLQSESEQTKVANATTVVPTPYQNTANGNTHFLPRPNSRTSTIYGNRSVTPQRRMQSQASSGRSVTPQPSVWDSMHAPTNTDDPHKRPTAAKSPRGRYPDLGPAALKTRRPPPHYHATIPSPTPSTVSLTPTQGDDGWWSISNSSSIY